MGCFESHYRTNKSGEEEEAPEGSGFLEEPNSYYGGTYGSYTFPYRIGCALGEVLGDFHK